uniref:Uncharacterized protein n=1 Tax=Podoviridae sp. ctlMy11 TaxID=2827746 RepID=A0A8S5TDC8_9CAUD|nr:MAG TPA: hypothetical protein [Podoviridae sp. ctlMy11]DAW10052.1 MAG TPA: hypothetical protein [Caudoviricetes sp.]
MSFSGLDASGGGKPLEASRGDKNDRKTINLSTSYGITS